MKKALTLFSFAILGFTALGQQASIASEDSGNRLYLQVKEVDEWQYAEPDTFATAVYGRGADFGASHPFVKGSSISGRGTTPPETGTCNDPTASNFGGSLPCITSDITVGGCTDCGRCRSSTTPTCPAPAPTNYFGLLPCTYDD